MNVQRTTPKASAYDIKSVGCMEQYTNTEHGNGAHFYWEHGCYHMTGWTVDGKHRHGTTLLIREARRVTRQIVAG